jgi:hypothetical protein
MNKMSGRMGVILSEAKNPATSKSALNCEELENVSTPSRLPENVEHLN